MFCAVSRLYSHSKKLECPWPAVEGHLRVGNPVGRQVYERCAELFGQDGNTWAIPALHYAQVRIVSRYGLVISGREAHGDPRAKARTYWHKQVWWCELIQEPPGDEWLLPWRWRAEMVIRGSDS